MRVAISCPRARALLAALLLLGWEAQAQAQVDADAHAHAHAHAGAVSPSDAQGPVNPDVNIIVYGCLDGETITAGYPDRETAVVTYKDHAYPLKTANAANGSRYVGFGLQWWVKGERAWLAKLPVGNHQLRTDGLSCTATSPRARSRAVRPR